MSFRAGIPGPTGALRCLLLAGTALAELFVKDFGFVKG
jgi:hypothetical protein